MGTTVGEHQGARNACPAGWIGYRGEIVIIIANGKTNGFLQRTDDTEALWVRLGELPDATRFTEPEMLWTPAVNRVKRLLRR